MNGKSIRHYFAFLTIVLIVWAILALPLSNIITRAQDGKDGVPPRRVGGSTGVSGSSMEELTGEVTVYIQLEAAPVAVAYAMATDENVSSVLRVPQEAAAAAGERQAEIVRSQQEDVQQALDDQGVDVLASTELALNSLMAVVDAGQIPDLKAIEGVVDVLVETPKYPDNSSSVPSIGAPTAWNVGFTGAGTRIGIIDSGIDYANPTFGTWTGAAWTGFNQGAAGTKVVGGYDFVGDAYTGANAPVPDNDPRDCQNNALAFPNGTVGHGTHVAGTAAGYGIRADGTTYPGPWNSAIPFSSMLVGPGAAPEASLYALRVFGCTGSTALTPLAIEWAMDPNRDGNPADHLDVINMSLGASNGAATDASAVAANNAAIAGVIVVASAGNSGDAYYVTGAPGTAPYAISVANSAESSQSPQVITGVGTFASAGAAFGDAVVSPITATLQLVNDGTAPSVTDACEAPVGFTAGNIAVVDRGLCGFAIKAGNVDAVGAIGMITCNNAPGAPIVQGDSTPPVVLTPPFFSVMISLADCNTLKAAMTGGLLTGVTIQPQSVENLNASSSRGPSRASGGMGGLGVTLKPDIAAPGTNITSSRSIPAVGGPRQTLSGTSMSAPHVAGVMALMRQAYPTWSVAALKALVMNTANVDTVGVAGPTAPNLGGAGRINVPNALRLSGNTPTRSVIAYSETAPERVSVSFGLIEAAKPSPIVRTQAIIVENRGSAPVTYTVSYSPRETAPGASFAVSPSQVTVPPGGWTNVYVTLTVDPNAATPFARDPNAAAFQVASAINHPRHWVSEASGLVLLQETTSQDTLRVPVYAASRPAGTMNAPVSVNTTGPTGTVNIPLAGQDVATGNNTNNSPQDVRGMVSAFQLMWDSPNDVDDIGDGLEDPLINHADLRYVGITSDYPAQLAAAGGNVATALSRTTVYVGLATWGDWSTLREVTFNVYFDTDENGSDNVQVRNVQLGAFVSSTTYYDAFWSFSTPPGSGSGARQAPVNEFLPSDSGTPSAFPVRNTYVLNNNVIVLPVFATGGSAGLTLGLTPANTNFNFRVQALSRDYGLVDTSPTLSYNIAAPALDFTGGFPGLPWWADFNGGAIPVNYNLSNFDPTAGRGLYALLLHHHNGGASTRAEIVCFAAWGFPACPIEDTTGAVGAQSSAALTGPGGPTSLPLTGYPPKLEEDGSLAPVLVLAMGILITLAGAALTLARRRSS